MGPRWKKKWTEAKARADSMSKIVSQLQSSLFQSNSVGLLIRESVLLEADDEQTVLLNRACFGPRDKNAEKNKQWFQLSSGRPIRTADEQTGLLDCACFGRYFRKAEKNKQLFQLSLEEAFYLCHSLKCLTIAGGDNRPKTDDELWQHMKSKSETFPYFYTAYPHLRRKNWVVGSGLKYGVDFAAYRHHPEGVHSEYAVLVLSEEDSGANGRLKVWSDIHCTTRNCGGVAKTLLVLYVNKNGHSDVSPSCLERFSIEERTITRWSPEQCREDRIIVENGAK